MPQYKFTLTDQEKNNYHYNEHNLNAMPL